MSKSGKQYKRLTLARRQLRGKKRDDSKVQRADFRRYDYRRAA